MTKRGRAQTILEYAAARSLISGYGLLPQTLAPGVSRLLGGITYRASRKLRRAGERNLELAFPEMSERERARILRGVFVNLSRQLAVFSRLSRMSREDVRALVDCEGLENLEEAKSRGRGLILVTGHLGAWEMTSFALSAFNHPLSFLVRRIDNPLVERMIDGMRTRFGNRTIDKRAAGRAMLRVLHAGETLGLLIDINTTASEGIFVDFFGKPAATTFLMAKLALRTGADVIPVFAPWEEEHGRFVLRIGSPLKIERTGDETEDVRRLTQAATRAVECHIRRYPDQWLWIHKRWRTRPQNEPEIY